MANLDTLCVDSVDSQERERERVLFVMNQFRGSLMANQIKAKKTKNKKTNAVYRKQQN